jgi:cardiolipin synthase
MPACLGRGVAPAPSGAAGQCGIRHGTASAPAALAPPPAPPAAPQLPHRARNWDEYRQRAALRIMVSQTPAGATFGPVHQPALAIPVLEVELNRDGSVRKVSSRCCAAEPGAATRCSWRSTRCSVRRRSARGHLPRPGATPRPSCSTTRAASSRARWTVARPAGPHRRSPAQIGPMFFTLPTLLTWARIVAIPLIVGVFYLCPTPATRNLVATVMFVVFALTDWLDGWLARKLNQTSAFGAFLDPVADKFLVCASLLVLVHLSRVRCALMALVIIGREIAISALREWMAQIGASRSVAVHMLGKVKTTTSCRWWPSRSCCTTAALFGVIDTRVWGTWLIWSLPC